MMFGVFQAGEKHYHPECSRCARCGGMFGEGEEMYLQGEAQGGPWHMLWDVVFYGKIETPSIPTPFL